MRRETKRRSVLYGGAIATAAVLLFLGFGLTLPPDLGTRLSGAAMLAGLGSYDEALEVVDQGIKEHPEHIDGYVYRAAILAQAQRFDEAIVAYDRVLEHDAATGSMGRSVRQDRASVLLAMGRTDEFEKARDDLAAGGVDQHVHALDGLAASKREDWPGALRHWEAAYKMEESAAARSFLFEALMEVGGAAVAAGRFDEARERFDRARQILPDVPTPFLKAAEVRLGEGDAKGALTAIGGCRDGVPGVAPLRVRAATMLLEAGEIEAAWLALESAFGCDPETTATLVEQEPTWKQLGNAERLAALRESVSQPAK